MIFSTRRSSVFLRCIKKKKKNDYVPTHGYNDNGTVLCVTIMCPIKNSLDTANAHKLNIFWEFQLKYCSKNRISISLARSTF